MIGVRAATLAAAAVACLAAATSASGPQVPSPIRDRAVVSAGMASLAGRVMAAEPVPRPVARAKVTLSGGPLREPRSVFTDAAGRFLFAGIPGGAYALAAERAAYLAGAYGSRRPGSTAGTPIAVADGQQVTDADIHLARGGVVTGVVRSTSGLPAADFLVQAVPVGGPSTEHVSGTTVVSTDDRGVYRLHGLVPGSYVVVARPSGPPPEVWRPPTRNAQPFPSASGADSAFSRVTGYAPVFHPGTADVSQAVVIRLGAAEERSGVDVTTVLVPLVSLTGRIVGAQGQPVDRSVVQLFRLEAPDAPGRLVLPTLRAGSDAEGRFLFPRVPPGRYRALVRWAPRSPVGVPALTDPVAVVDAALAMLAQPSRAGAFWAQHDVVVEGQDIGGIELRLRPAMMLSGRLVAEGATQPTRELARARVLVAPLPDRPSTSDLANAMPGATLASVAADGTFEAQGLVPGAYRVQLVSADLARTGATASSPAWILKSVMLGDRDVADASFDVRPGEDVTGVIVTMTDRPTEITGRVIDSAGRPATGYPIVVFSTDKRYWTFGSRRIQHARPASDGRYRISGLPPGEYFVCAATEVAALELYSPELLEQLVAGSFKLTLGDGEKKMQDLKLGSGG